MLAIIAHTQEDKNINIINALKLLVSQIENGEINIQECRFDIQRPPMNITVHDSSYPEYQLGDWLYYNIDIVATKVIKHPESP